MRESLPGRGRKRHPVAGTGVWLQVTEAYSGYPSDKENVLQGKGQPVES